MNFNCKSVLLNDITEIKLKYQIRAYNTTRKGVTVFRFENRK